MVHDDGRRFTGVASPVWLYVCAVISVLLPASIFLLLHRPDESQGLSQNMCIGKGALNRLVSPMQC